MIIVAAGIIGCSPFNELLVASNNQQRVACINSPLPARSLLVLFAAGGGRGGFRGGRGGGASSAKAANAGTVQEFQGKKTTFDDSD